MQPVRIERARINGIAAKLRAEGFDPDIEGEWYAIIENDIRSVARVRQIAGHEVLDCVWVHPDHRSIGFGTKLVTGITDERDALWLICDEETGAFYDRLGFRTMAVRAAPEPLVAHWNARGELPSPEDHEHVVMRRP